MKIKIIDSISKKPLTNMKIQLQVKGKDSGFITMNTDQNGELRLDDKYKGQQLAGSINGVQSQWMTVNEGIMLSVECKQQKQADKMDKNKNKETWK